MFDLNNKVAIQDPVYPAYLDANVIAGRSGELHITNYENIIYMVTNSTNDFVPEIPRTKVDLIYLCYPNNPTGMALTKDIPHSIYEIEGAKEVAIEFKSFSKTAGFAGVRCSYTIVPKVLKGYTSNNLEVSINNLWTRRQYTKFNGESYITQRGAEATYLPEAKRDIESNIQYYLKNAKTIKQGLEDAEFEVYGGVNSPYVWLKVPNAKTSWQFFDELLENIGIVGIPRKWLWTKWRRIF